MQKPTFHGRPIGSVQALARMLGDTEARIRRIAENSDRMYHHRCVMKGRKPREVFDAMPQLKRIQQKINEKILLQVNYPTFLHGGLRGRDYISDCTLHIGAKVAVTQDISKFFPSIQREDVRRIWQYFFRFPPEVAAILANLTTREGVVPQGAKTSGFLANLLFWEEEPALEARLADQGLRYSRFVDDITVSSNRTIEKAEVTAIIDSIVSMFRRHGLHRNKEKSRVHSANRPIRVHGVHVNGRQPNMPKNERRKIRARIHRAEMAPPDSLDPKELECLAGKAGLVARLHEREGNKMKQQVTNLAKRQGESRPARQHGSGQQT